LLEEGVKVALVYGDRDYACNWYGGEALSLAIPFDNATNFAAAGYAPVVVNDTYIGGQVRQYGNLSFTRVYQAGHEVPAYQPETAFKIFQRALFNFDIATGNISTSANLTYSTEGPKDVSNVTNEPIPFPGAQCYVLDREQCTEEQWETVMDGTALIKNWIVVDANTTSLFPELAQNGTNSTTSPTESGSSPPAETAGAYGRARVRGWEVMSSAFLSVVLGSSVFMW
jgi:hypothetical protein